MRTAISYCTCEGLISPRRFFFLRLSSIQEKKFPILTKLYDVHCMLRAPAYFPPEAFKSAQASNSSRGSLRLC